MRVRGFDVNMVALNNNGNERKRPICVEILTVGHWRCWGGRFSNGLNIHCVGHLLQEFLQDVHLDKLVKFFFTNGFHNVVN
jgi:hypothetical protein